MIVLYNCNLYNSIHQLYFNENKLRNFKKTRCAPHRPKGGDGRETRSSFPTCRKEIGKKLQNCQWAGAGAGGWAVSFPCWLLSWSRMAAALCSISSQGHSLQRLSEAGASCMSGFKSDRMFPRSPCRASLYASLSRITSKSCT